MIILEDGPGGLPALFDGAAQIIRADRLDEVPQALATLDAARGSGKWVAGWIAYEAGNAFEPRLTALHRGTPLIPERRAIGATSRRS